jgi:hypothetical protein
MVMVFEMYTHMSSAESIEKDLVSMHKHVYPNLKRGVDYCIPGVATLKEWRGDSQFFTEIIAAVRCGRAPYWKQLFHDGSSDRRCTKIFSTLASIPDEDIGGKHDALLLRGLHLIAGGESADEIADIRTTVDRMAENLELLMRSMQKDGISGDTIKELVPPKTAISLLKLARGSVMSDNANAAKKTSELVAEAMQLDAEAHYDGTGGRQLWAQMNEEEQKDASCLFVFTCWNHIRNLFCNEAVTNEAEVMKRHIPEDDLAAANKELGRSDAGSASGAMRAAFKEFSTNLDNYKKGQGEDFEHWFKHVWAKKPTEARRAQVKAGVFLYPLERLDHGARFDMQLEGAIAVLLNSEYWVEFLEYRVQKNSTEKLAPNILETSLLAHFKSLPVQSCLRARAALAIKANAPMRAMTNSETGDKRRSPLDMAGPCSELWSFAEKVGKGAAFLFKPEYLSPFTGAPEADAWRLQLEQKEVGGFTTDGQAMRCAIWPRLSRLLHTEDQAPDGITLEVAQAHARGILSSLNRNAAKFLPRREFDDEEIKGGIYCVANQTEEMREQCRGMLSTNDCAESSFALFDYICRRSSGLSIQSASGVTQMVFNRDLCNEGKTKDTSKDNRAGWFHRQKPELQRAIVRCISHFKSYFKGRNEQDKEEQAQRAAQRAEDVRKLHLTQVAERFIKGTKALEVERVATAGGVDAALTKANSKTAKLDFLKGQIKIYTHGVQVLGAFTFPKVAWSCKTNESIGTVATLTAELKSMIDKVGGAALPVEPPLELKKRKVISLGAMSEQEGADGEQEAEFRAAVMAEVARAGAEAGVSAPEAPQRRAPVVMVLPADCQWEGRTIQVLHSSAEWRTGTIHAVSKENDVYVCRPRVPRRGGGGAEAAERRVLLGAGRVQVSWEGASSVDGEWWWLQRQKQFPLCKGEGAWRVLSRPLTE